MIGYGHPPHKHSPEDLQVWACRHCGWYSDELTKADLRELGTPVYCERCRKGATSWVTFHPSERARAYQALGVPEPTKNG